MAHFYDLPNDYTTPQIINIQVGRALPSQDKKEWTITYLQKYASFTPTALNSTYTTGGLTGYLVEETLPEKIGGGMVRFQRVYVELPATETVTVSGLKVDYGRAGFKNKTFGAGASIYGPGTVWSEYGVTAPSLRRYNWTRTTTYHLTQPTPDALEIPPTFDGSTVDWEGTRYVIDNSSVITPEQIAAGFNRWVSDGSTVAPSSGARASEPQLWRGKIWTLVTEA